MAKQKPILFWTKCNYIVESCKKKIPHTMRIVQNETIKNIQIRIGSSSSDNEKNKSMHCNTHWRVWGCNLYVNNVVFFKQHSNWNEAVESESDGKGFAQSSFVFHASTKVVYSPHLGSFEPPIQLSFSHSTKNTVITQKYLVFSHWLSPTVGPEVPETTS